MAKSVDTLSNILGIPGGKPGAGSVSKELDPKLKKVLTMPPLVKRRIDPEKAKRFMI